MPEACMVWALRALVPFVLLLIGFCIGFIATLTPAILFATAFFSLMGIAGVSGLLLWSEVEEFLLGGMLLILSGGFFWGMRTLQAYYPAYSQWDMMRAIL